MKKTIMVWVPDSSLERELKLLCSAAPRNHWFVWAETMQDVCDFIQKHHIDLLIVHPEKPYSDFSVLVNRFQMVSLAPIFAFFDNEDAKDLIFGFGLVEDGMILPFESDKEFIVRCMSLINSTATIQKGENNTIERISKRGVTIDVGARLVIISGERVDNLTRIEFDLLFYLMLNIDIVLSRQQIYENVWKNTFAYDIDDTVKCHIKTLRKKIRCYMAEEIVETVIGVGYKISSKTYEQLSFDKVSFA